MYSFVEDNPKKFLPYEVVKKRGEHELPLKVKQKMEKGSKLKSNEAQAIRAYEEMQEDLEKDPKDRIRGLKVVETFDVSALELVCCATGLPFSHT